MRRHKADARALALGLPERFGRLHALRLRQHVFREHDAVPALAVAADGHRHIPQRRVVQRLDRRVEIVHIDVQDDAVHSSSSPWEPSFGTHVSNICSCFFENIIEHAFSTVKRKFLPTCTQSRGDCGDSRRLRRLRRLRINCKFTIKELAPSLKIDRGGIILIRVKSSKERVLTCFWKS